MKRILLLAISTVMGVGSLFAQNEDLLSLEKMENRMIWKDRAKYFNIGFVKQDVSAIADDFEIDLMKSDWGVSLSSGKTFYLHKQPIGGMVKFGLDWTWFDLNVAGHSYYDYFAGDGYEDSFDGYYSEEDAEKVYQAEIGMQVGPSITINPVHHLKISAYFRVTPSYSAFYMPDYEEGYGGYMTVCNVGGAIAWKLLSLGVEYRSGKAIYKEFGGDSNLLDAGDDTKIMSKGLRFYFGFRF